MLPVKDSKEVAVIDLHQVLPGLVELGKEVVPVPLRRHIGVHDLHHLVELQVSNELVLVRLVLLHVGLGLRGELDRPDLVLGLPKLEINSNRQSYINPELIVLLLLRLGVDFVLADHLPENGADYFVVLLLGRVEGDEVLIVFLN